MIESYNMFEIPLIRVASSDWKRKKKEIRKHINYRNIKRKNNAPFLTDRFSDNFYTNEFSQIFKDELNVFLEKIKKIELKITSMWSVSYWQGDYHPTHNHGGIGYSAILHYDHNPRLHDSAYFISPLPDPLTGDTAWRKFGANEGDFYFFPSSILHFTTPNKSPIIRRSIGFDIIVP
tara:strand:+ start:148 stop:678 length:531 start_codon:yes stop_codon:yes gene_type:complete